MPIFFGINIDLKVPADYIVVSDTGFTIGGLEKKMNKDQEKASDQLVRDVKAGRHPDSSNPLVIFARSQTDVEPAGLAERSMVLPLARGYVRETNMGLIYFSLLPDAMGMILGVYPTP